MHLRGSWAWNPAEVRLRNFVPKEDFPYKTAGGLEYDSGDYAMNLRKALELSQYDKWREEQRRGRAQGRMIGIGLATYVEICAFGPDFPQTGAVSVSASGAVTVITGNSPHGQGHETPLSQIVADKLGIPLDQIVVTYGDTMMLPWGTFTAGSRSAALGGSAVLMSAEKIKNKMARIASAALEVPEEDLVFKDGEIIAKSRKADNPKKKISFAKVASTAYHPSRLPKGMESVLFEFSSFNPPNFTFPFGTHIAVVEIERETGRLRILDYTAVDDCGKVINPLIVEGQNPRRGGAGIRAGHAGGDKVLRLGRTAQCQLPRLPDTASGRRPKYSQFQNRDSYHFKPAGTQGHWGGRVHRGDTGVQLTRFKMRSG